VISAQPASRSLTRRLSTVDPAGKKWNVASGIVSLVEREFKSAGDDASHCLVITSGLCIRLPVGRPLAVSRGETIVCETLNTSIDVNVPSPPRIAPLRP
jgi:hypothetical protein